MSAEENKAVERRVIEELNRGSLDIVDQLFAPNYVYHGPVEAKGPEGFKQFWSMATSAFPDLKMTIDDMIAEGDKVVTLYTLSGTHKSDFMGIPASGNQVKVPVTLIVRFKDGKEEEAWGRADMLTLLQQLGAIPPMSQPSK